MLITEEKKFVQIIFENSSQKNRFLILDLYGSETELFVFLFLSHVKHDSSQIETINKRRVFHSTCMFTHLLDLIQQILV